jgi:hypothetical protein
MWTLGLQIPLGKEVIVMTALKKLWLLLLIILAVGCTQPPPAPEIESVAPCADGTYRVGLTACYPADVWASIMP